MKKEDKEIHVAFLLTHNLGKGVFPALSFTLLQKIHCFLCFRGIEGGGDSRS